MSGSELPGITPRGCVRLLMIGDIVGKPGIRMVCQSISWLRRELRADAIIANAENAADGSGLRCKDYRRLIDVGIDGITLGDHLYKKREIIETLDSQANIIRPANLPPEAPGKTHMILNVRDQIQVAVICVLGRVFMKPVDCPFRAVERQLDAIDPAVKVRLVEFHAEATSDMQLMGRYLDGRSSGVLGTHTHVATADEQILPGGSGFQCDVGMTGPFDSILGRKIEAVLESTLHGVPLPYQVATGDVRLNGTWLDIDVSNGKCQAIGRVDLREATIASYHLNHEATRRVL